jgi:4-hydroxymandelate oxidase
MPLKRQSTRKKAPSRAPPVNLKDLRTSARALVASDVFDYIDGGACDEITKKGNRRDLDHVRLLPLCLRDVSELKLTSDFLGHTFNWPLGFSPTAFHRLVHEDGEIAAASAARTLNVPMILSCMSSVCLEQVVQDSGNKDLWFQTYIFKDRALTRELVGRAERSGYKAIVVTIGCPVAGKRDKNLKSKFVLPNRVTAANFKPHELIDHNNPIHSFHGAELDASLTWKDIEWLRSNTHLPLILKGIMSPLDVVPALDLEVSGLIVSNHGGRQLDTTESTISILPEIAATVARRVPLLVDSGFRRGTDLLKAFALGADGVLLGRPVLWALAYGGEDGVVGAANLLLDELRVAMQLIGCSSIDVLRENSMNIVRRR